MRKLGVCISILSIILILCVPFLSATAASYVIGDADGDGYVTTMDATLMQRVLVYLIDDPDGEISMRGDVDGNGYMDETDVTLIKRYCAFMDVNYPIGETSDDPTEPPTEPETQPPTQKPTQKPDPYELPPI